MLRATVAILAPFYYFIHSIFLGILPAVQLLQAYHSPRKFAVKVDYAEQPIVVRGRTSDVSVFYEIFALKLYKVPEEEILSIMDLGANVGYASIYFAHFFPKARIIAVEPEVSNYSVLLENTQNYQNISCVHAPVWPEEIELTLQNPDGSNWSFHYKEPEDIASGPVIKAQTLPGLMAKFNLERISLLKIDIEGGENDLFAFDTDWLSCVDCLQIEIHSDEAKKTVFNALAAYPYSSVHTAFNNYYITLNHHLSESKIS
jgi:FkbM family methyltransferase